MAKNNNLHNAKRAKNDEFYTQLSDIEKECKNYKKHFINKTIYCNCDDPRFSQFWEYFHLNFTELGLKKLIATFISFNEDKPFIAKYEGGNDNDISVYEKLYLKGNGSFDSEECKEILKKADIVISNPPFSLFRKYIALLEEYGKKYLVIGNKNAINYLCPLVKDNKLWFGVSTNINEFDTPNGITKTVAGLTRWFTNLDHNKRHEKLILYKTYDEENYPIYDNYDAINVDKTADIPIDYNGVMGVPISFLDKYNPEQFEIIGITYSKDRNSDIEKVRTSLKNRHVGIIGGKEKYPRVLIKAI